MEAAMAMTAAAMPAVAGSEAMASLLLDGKCLVFDEFEGAVPFAGIVGGKRSTEGDLHWDTHPPGHVENVFGMKSLAGPGQRDVTLMLVDYNVERLIVRRDDENNKPRKLITLGLDFDFIRRLHDKEREAGDELLGMVMGHSEHFAVYDIQTLWQ